MKKHRLHDAVNLGLVCAILALAGFHFATPARAAALSSARDTPIRDGDYVVLTVASNSIIYAGAIVAVNSSGYAVPASDSSGLQVVGRCEVTADNRTANYVATKAVTIRRGVFRYANGDTVADANIGDIAYIEDDQTVSVTNSGTYSIIAGVVVDVDDDGVWVDCGQIDRTAGAFTTLSASGASVLAGTLGVTGAVTAASTAAISGNTTVGGTLGVTGNTTLTGTLTVNGATLAGDGDTIVTNMTAYWLGAVGYIDTVVTNGVTNLVFVSMDGSMTTNIIDADINN